MATSSDSSPSPAPRRGLRYSLRALLIVVTLACIGVWYWYRVPFAKEVVHSATEGYWWREKAGPVRRGREVQRFRRTLRGEPVREGRTDWFDSTGRRVHEEHWRENQRHGRSISWFTNGNVRSRGQYQMGRLDGLWEQFDEEGQPTYQLRYENGRPNGEWVVYGDGKPSRTYRFEHGEAKGVNGQPLDDPLGRAARLGQIDEERVQEAMFSSSNVSFQRTPLRDFATLLGANYQVNVALDWRSLSRDKIEEPVSIDVEPISVGGLLVVALEPMDLAATYRFGMIWITTKEDAAEWVDQTGVTTLLENPPAEATEQQRAAVKEFLDKPAEFDLVDVPMRDVARFITQSFRPIELKWDQPNDLRPVNSTVRGISHRNALGALCDQHDLRIRWTKGTTLIVEPQEDRQPGLK